MRSRKIYTLKQYLIIQEKIKLRDHLTKTLNILDSEKESADKEGALLRKEASDSIQRLLCFTREEIARLLEKGRDDYS